MRTSHTPAFIILVILLFAPFAAKADDSAAPAADKSGYNLFDPVPDDQMRSFATDRPAKSDTPYTVDAGHFQYESDFVSWTYDRYNASHATTSNLTIFDTVLKAGLTNKADFELALSPINIDQSSAGGTRSVFAGFGDIYARVKYNIIGDDGGNYVMSIVPYVKAPSANQHIGNQHWEGGGYVPFTVALPDDWTMGFTSEMDILENAALNGTHTNFSNLINFSHTVFDPDVTGQMELWSDVNNDAGAATQYTADVALAWAVNGNLQLDGGVNFGLNKAAPDVQPYIGISQRF